MRFYTITTINLLIAAIALGAPLDITQAQVNVEVDRYDEMRVEGQSKVNGDVDIVLRLE